MRVDLTDNWLVPNFFVNVEGIAMSEAYDKQEPLLKSDIVLEVDLYGFKKDTIQKRRAIIVERNVRLPLRRAEDFIESVAVPINGRIKMTLCLIERNERRLLAIDEMLPTFRFAHSIGSLYNHCQKGLGRVPVVGKVLEDIAPDAKEKIKVAYAVAISTTRLLSYTLTVWNRNRDGAAKFFKGEVQV